MSVTLHTDIEDPHARLRAIHASAAESKVGAERTKAMMPDDLPSIGLPWLLGGLARLMTRQELIGRLPLPTNVIISNVAGPPVPLYVAGAKALTYSPVSIPYHGCALNITVYSYDGRLFFGLTGARSALPDLQGPRGGRAGGASVAWPGVPPQSAAAGRNLRAAARRQGAKRRA